MRYSSSLGSTLLAIFVTHSIAPAEIIKVSDNFDDNSLNTTVWSTHTPQTGYSSVTEVNQHVEIVDRGYLYTNEQFDPLATGQIKVTGTWTLGGVSDILVVSTRSDATPNTVNSWWLRNGIAFEYNDTIAMCGISTYVNFTQTSLASTAVNFDPGEQIAFEILDDGNSLSFSLNGNGKSATITASSNIDYTTDYVAFLNREYVAGVHHTAYLDNVQVSAVPEPSTIAAIVTGAMGVILVWAWRRRRPAAPGQATQEPFFED